VGGRPLRARDLPLKIKFAPDSPLEGTGFEPSVPLLQKALLGVADRDVGHDQWNHLMVRSEIARIDLGGPPMPVPFAAGPMVRMLFPPPARRPPYPLPDLRR